MDRVAKFEKVSFEAFNKGCIETFDDAFNIQDAYDYDLSLPIRKTKGSAGYDFLMPFSLVVCAGETVTFPTGIRCKMKGGTVLLLMPRSSLGFKYGFRLENTIGVIDSDYYYSDNEGHIRAKFTNNSDKDLTLNVGDAYMQGIFVNFGITEDDEADGIRNGGFGSTNDQPKRRYFSKDIFIMVEGSSEYEYSKTWVDECDGKEVVNGKIVDTCYDSIVDWEIEK